MPVRPSKNPKIQAHLLFYDKPEHTKPAAERSFSVARDLLKSERFLQACKARGVKATLRQARKYQASFTP